MVRGEGHIKVMIAAGGTGGHVFPGIAVAEEIAKQAPGAEIVFAGTSRGLESEIVPRHGWKIVLMKSNSLKDKSGLAKLVSALRIPVSVAVAIGTIRSERPDLLIGIGGYAAGPLAVAAWAMRIPVALVEPNAIPGMTNRLLKRFARKVFVAYPEAMPDFGGKAVLTGVPVRREILDARHGEKVQTGRTTVLAFGGSQGARSINRAMVDAVDSLRTVGGALRIIHQTGANDDHMAIARAYDEAGIEAEVFPFKDAMWDCYERADIAVARAGANTVAELSSLGIPSILVPYPFAADDHQRANAMGMARAGGAVVISDDELTGDRLAEALRELATDHDRLEGMRLGALGFGKPDAARRIVREALALIW
jgi:UDP-N-acetylglucosamine--N-acetylmuramyl-(pentapeptide) pyrophosphoryl-undecaprenol N-acetylglucosamine transferase